MRTVVLVSADGEWNAVCRLFPKLKPAATELGERFDPEIAGRPLTFFHGGWGKVSAAATTQFVIDQLRPDLIINLGTCGGFQGRIEQGIIVLVEKTIIYDIVEQMTDPAAAIKHYSTSLDLSWLPLMTPTPVLRGHLVSGDRDILPQSIPELVGTYNAVAADWESGAIAWVAGRNHQRLLILRGVSDLVGSEGGEAYGDYELFLDRTRAIMRHLIDILPKWLEAIESA